MLEREIEKRLGAELRKRGCLYYKFVSPGAPGVPDRMVIAPDGRVYFIELKTSSGRLSAQQRVQIEKIRRHGVAVEVVYGLSDAMAFLDRFGREK